MAYNGPLPQVVNAGGSGVASATAYSVLCGGTSSTGAFQSVSGLGTTGQVLTSNDASALPTWETLGAPSVLPWTPTIVGGTVAGTTTYAVQSGNYYTIGKLTFAVAEISVTGATGTGDLTVRGWPVVPTAKSTAALYFGSTGLTWPTDATSVALYLSDTAGYAFISTVGSETAQENMQLQDGAFVIIFGIIYL